MFNDEFHPYDILHQHEHVINTHTLNFTALIEFVNTQQAKIVELETRIKQLEDKQ